MLQRFLWFIGVTYRPSRRLMDGHGYSRFGYFWRRKRYDQDSETPTWGEPFGMRRRLSSVLNTRSIRMTWAETFQTAFLIITFVIAVAGFMWFLNWLGDQ